MLKLLFISAGICLFANSCSNHSAVNIENPAGKESPITCYRYAQDGDTISMELVDMDTAYTGTLVYALKEKDENLGVFYGKMVNDLLIADYTFNSEGVKSVRQVVFKKSGNKLVEGFGQIVIKSDKAVFRHLDSLSFNDKFSLSAVDCSK
jgi:hypothetical protein